jgi:4-hydroxybenzoate polyprenyltransferase
LLFGFNLFCFPSVFVAPTTSKIDRQREIRALLILGRVSNLPTVWSNCLAGWLLSGGGSLLRFGLLCLGGSSLYLGGMFLNDAFDAEFDLQHRKERPIPSASINLSQVWGWGFGWLAAGALLLSLLGRSPFLLGLALIATIVLYDAIHKAITLSPLLMALCRLLLYVLAGAAAEDGVTGATLWSAIALACYVVGLSYLARGERGGGSVLYWPSCLLAAPMLLAWAVNAGAYKARAIGLSIVLVVWVVRCLREALWAPTQSVGRAVSGLLAGICLVDLLAVAGGTPVTAATFLLMFILALLGQRFIPAT